jgi:NADP-dependent 3-hydroxy acid dehydrogenase YdfG
MLKEKIFVVTGASDGIGKQIGMRLVKEHATVVFLGRDEARLKQSAGSSPFFVCDLRDNQITRDVAEHILKEFPIIDGLVNSAGIWHKTGNLETFSDQIILDVLRTNLEGMVMLTKHLLPALLKSDSGSIINVSSRSGYSAQEGQSVYSASKYGVRGFTEVLRLDLMNTNVRVAGIYQGGTNTNMFRKAGQHIPDEKYDEFIPPEEIADVVTYMLGLPKRIWLPEVRIESK